MEPATCFTPNEESVLIRFSESSFKNGIMGSMRTDVGIPFSMSVSTAFRRSDGDVALGSRSLASASLSVVIVIETVEAVFLRMSMSLVTKLDFVII